MPVTASEWLADLTPVPRPGEEDTVPLTVIRVSPAEPAALVSFNDCGHLPPDDR